MTNFGKIENWKLNIVMEDSSVWQVPVKVIAESRAKYYFEDRKEFKSLQESLDKDTIPLFLEGDDYDIVDWSANNMNWSDVEKFAKKVVKGEIEVDYQEGWINGEKEVVKE